MERDYPVKTIKCGHCLIDLDCYTNAQKYCLHEDNPSCYDERITSKMTDKEFAKYRGSIHENKAI